MDGGHAAHERGAPLVNMAHETPHVVLVVVVLQGDKWQLFIPSELAYGERQQGRYITPGAVLLFDLELIKVRRSTMLTTC